MTGEQEAASLQQSLPSRKMGRAEVVASLLPLMLEAEASPSSSLRGQDTKQKVEGKEEVEFLLSISLFESNGRATFDQMTKHQMD